MHLKAIVVQGLFGVAKGVQLPLSSGLCEPLLPPPLDVPKLRNVIALLLYPVDAMRSGGVHVDTSVPYSVRLGAVLEIGGLEYKLKWDIKGDELEIIADGKVVASGREEAQALWNKLLGLLPYPHFGPVHVHEFFEDGSTSSTGEGSAELIESYRRSLSVERIESEIADVEGKLQDLESSSDPASRLESALDRVIKRLKRFEDLPDLRDEDREFLASYDARTKATRAELDDVLDTLHETEQKLVRRSPKPIIRDTVFWVGVLLGLGCMIAAYVLQASEPRFRAIALGNVLGFGIALASTLKHINQHEAHGSLRRYQSQLDERRAELEKTLEREGLRLKRLKQRYDAGTAEQIVEDFEEREKLQERRKELEQKLKEHLNDPEFLRRRSETKQLRERLEKLRAEREPFGDFVMPTYELRSELESRGIAVETLRPLDAAPEAPLVDAARQLGLIPSDSDEATADDLAALNRHVPAVLGEREAHVTMRDGALYASVDTRATPLRELEPRRQRPWLRAMALGLLTAHRAQRSASGDQASILLLADPWAGMQRNERVRFYSLLKEMAREFQVLIPKVGRADGVELH